MVIFNNPRRIATTATTSATLTRGSHTPVDATAGALTMTLPTNAPVGTEISVEKVDASPNAVTISGTYRGTASNLTLTSQYEARTFLSEGSGSWRPISDHRTTATIEAPVREFATRPSILRYFNPSATDVAIERVTSKLHYFLQHLGNQRWVRTELRSADTLGGGAAPGGGTSNTLDGCIIARPVLTRSLTNAAHVFTGTGWLGSTGVTDAAAYASSYDRSGTAGNSVTITTPANTIAVGIRSPMAVNAGLSKVTIDGDATRATLLPTAQDLVTSGAFPNTILVANGGSLNPTDRVLDQYASVGTIKDQRWMFADDLVLGAHTVVVTSTGFKRAASSDIRVYFSASEYSLSNTTLSTATATLAPLRSVMGAATGVFGVYNSESVRAQAVLFNGAGTNTFIGGYHGYEFVDSLSFTVDGVAVTLADGQRVAGSVVVGTQQAHLRHPDSGTTNLATSTMTYTLSLDGLRVEDVQTWAGAHVVNSAYSAMFPTMQETFKIGRIDTSGVTYPLTAHDGSVKGHLPGRVLAMWEPGGKAAVALYLPDPSVTVDGWARSFFGVSSVNYLAFQDNSANALSKGYATRIATGSTPYTTTSGEVWRSVSYRKVAWISAGADVLTTA